MKVSTGQLARRYATALFESAVETGQVDALSAEANALIGVLSSEVELFFRVRQEAWRKKSRW